MAVDLIQWIRDGRAHAKWGDLVSEHNGHTLVLNAMRDAMTFDGVPELRWDRHPVPAHEGPTGATFDGVRMASTAKELQEIADLLFCMMMTPKITDLVQAAAMTDGTHIEPVVNVNRKIVATCHIHHVHEAVEAAIAKAGGDEGGFIASVGKYWVICNRLLGGKFGKNQATNYGWFSKYAKSWSVTRIGKIYQTIGGVHDSEHFDPSQVIRLVSRMAKLLRAGSTTWEDVDLYNLAVDPELAPLISHEGVLKTTRMLNVPEPKPVTQDDGTILMPEMLFLGSMNDQQPLLDMLLDARGASA